MLEIVSNEPEGCRDAWLVLEGGHVAGEFAWRADAEKFVSELCHRKSLQK